MRKKHKPNYEHIAQLEHELADLIPPIEECENLTPVVEVAATNFTQVSRATYTSFGKKEPGWKPTKHVLLDDRRDVYIATWSSSACISQTDLLRFPTQGANLRRVK